jgi:hypothetical protein
VAPHRSEDKDRQSGTGKTTTIRKILEQLAGGNQYRYLIARRRAPRIFLRKGVSWKGWVPANLMWFLQQSPSTTKRRRPEELVEALSLDIVGFTRGSPAAVAQFERSENQMGLEGLDFGEQTYRALIEGIEIAASLGDSLPPGFDLGVLMKLRDIGKLFYRGVNRMEFTLNHYVSPLKASFDNEKCDRIRHRIEQPEAQRQTIEGRLLMADFKETGRQLRVHPPVIRFWS